MNREPHTRSLPPWLPIAWCLFQHNKFIPWLLAVGGAHTEREPPIQNSWPYFSNLFKIDNDCAHHCEIEAQNFWFDSHICCRRCHLCHRLIGNRLLLHCCQTGEMANGTLHILVRCAISAYFIFNGESHSSSCALLSGNVLNRKILYVHCIGIHNTFLHLILQIPFANSYS